MADRSVSIVSRVFWTAVFTFHGLAAAAWGWMMPGRLSAGHARFWANRIVPAVVVALVLAAAIARARGWRRAFAALAVAVPAAWLGAVAGALVVFPTSGRPIAAAGFVGAVVLASAWVLSCRRDLIVRHAAPVAFASFLTGAVRPLTKRGPAPTARPISHDELAAGP